MKKRKKKRIKFKGLIFIILIIYLLIMAFYYVWNLPIKNIEVKGNKYTTESEIIKASTINKKTKLFKISSYRIKKGIKKLDYINSVKVSKDIFGKITIEVTEESILIYNMLDSNYILSNGKEVSLDEDIIGIPSLINYVPDDILTRFAKNFAKIDESVRAMVSEIEYNPDIKEEVTIDDERFFLKMNDGNAVYINIINMDKLNKYKEAIASVFDQTPGVLSLDSNSNNTLFITYDKIKANQETTEVVEEGE